MILRASTPAEVCEALAEARASNSRIQSIDLRAMSNILEYRPEDMTVTVQTGISMAVLQAHLANRGQWLPIDPPNPERLTIDELLNRNLSGPRRFGYGTIREHLIGVTAVLADGRVIHNGGKVVKNVAGFDLCKLFVGSQWTVGIVIEATFKVRPLPAREVFWTRNFAAASEAADCVQSVLESQIAPVVIDLHSDQFPACTLVLGLAGTSQEVAWQSEEAEKLGIATERTLGYERDFWTDSSLPFCVSVLPSRLAAELELCRPKTFVARAGNGIIFYRGGSAREKPGVPVTLNQRVKQIFDPARILPEFAL